ncbi:hypothetical protein Taro_021680 [Colocasia esculenta]|uniref:Uncharacterized protein n=1 Tax=Colocasia esculenta TaxID=4460 RepID=A0A843V345_COLES|nr:hypothetical protein [Colocasia esculenta]
MTPAETNGVGHKAEAVLSTPAETTKQPRTTFSCKGSVDTTISGVDTMAQSKDRNVKKRSTSVDTSPGQVDTKCRQVDTRWLSQKTCFAVWDMVSTLNHLRSTLETSPRELICQSGTVDTTPSSVDTLSLRSTLTSSSVDTDPPARVIYTVGAG